MSDEEKERLTNPSEDTGKDTNAPTPEDLPLEDEWVEEAEEGEVFPDFARNDREDDLLDVSSTGFSDSRIKKDAKKASRSVAAGVVALCIFIAFFAGCIGAFIGMKIANTTLTFDRAVRRIKANTGNGPAETTIAEVAAGCIDAVISVMGSYDETEAHAVSSGVVISREDNTTYLAVCCLHGVDGYPYLRVQTDDGRQFAAEVIGVSVSEDLALLKITANDLKVAVFTSRAPVMGETVVALGNPVGTGLSASVGFVSRTECEAVIGGIPMDLMKLDCNLNHGNSGGGVFDMEGHLLGIVCAKTTADGDGKNVEGIAYAIPSHKAIGFLSEMESTGQVAGEMTFGIGLAPSKGTYEPLVISEYLYPDELAEGSALLPGDTIMSVSYPDARTKNVYPSSAAKLTNAEARANLRSLSYMGEPGDPVYITVKREGAGVVTVTVKLHQTGY